MVLYAAHPEFGHGLKAEPGIWTLNPKLRPCCHHLNLSEIIVRGLLLVALKE